MLSRERNSGGNSRRPLLLRSKCRVCHTSVNLAKYLRKHKQ